MGRVVSSSIGRTLLGIAGLYGTATAASFLFLRWYRPSLIGDAGVMPVALVALPLAASLGYLLGSRRYVQEERLLLRSIERPVFEDGQRGVAIGRIEPLGALVRSPFTGKDCVAYQYEIDHAARGAKGRRIRVRDYWGMAVSPGQVLTPAGPVRILGYARLEAFPEELDDDAYGAAEAYVRSTLFRHPTSPGERLGSLAEPLSTESDSFRDDICADPTHVGAWPEVPGDLRKTAAPRASPGRRADRVCGRVLLRGQEGPRAHHARVEATADLDLLPGGLGRRQPGLGEHLCSVGDRPGDPCRGLRPGHEVVLIPARRTSPALGRVSSRDAPAFRPGVDAC